MIIDYCVDGAPKEDINNIPDDSKDVEDLDEGDSQKLLKPKKPTKIPVSVPTLVASSTPQRPTKPHSSPVIEIQDDEALINEVLAADQDDDDSEGLNTSDVAQVTDEEEQTTNSPIRQRRANK
jgi:hypothetical protein